MLSPSGKCMSIEFHISQYLLIKAMLELGKEKIKTDFPNFSFVPLHLTIKFHAMSSVFYCVLTNLSIKITVYGSGEMLSSAVQYCSCKGLRFGSQHTHDDPQLSVSPIPGTLCKLLWLSWTPTCARYRDSCRHTHMHTKWLKMMHIYFTLGFCRLLY